jgi:flagellar biosynthesis protein FlhB
MAGPGAAGRVLGGVGWIVLGSGGAALALAAQWSIVASLPQIPLAAGIRQGAQVCLLTALTAFGVLAVLAIVDVLAARFRWTSQLAMTTQEAREEQRQSDGDPNVRVRRKRAAARLRGVLPNQGKEPMKGAAC